MPVVNRKEIKFKYFFLKIGLGSKRHFGPKPRISKSPIPSVVMRKRSRSLRPICVRCTEKWPTLRGRSRSFGPWCPKRPVALPKAVWNWAQVTVTVTTPHPATRMRTTISKTRKVKSPLSKWLVPVYVQLTWLLILVFNTVFNLLCKNSNSNFTI